MELATFTVGGKNYTASKLSAMVQFHIVRKMAPLLAGMLPPDVQSKDIGSLLLSKASAVLPGLADSLSKLSDQDSEFVLYGLLGCVKQEQPNGLGWAPVVVNKQMMFDNITMPDMILIAVKSAQHNFRDFLNALPQPSPGAK